ncbi:hypothetical protein BC826DRAFT_1046550 [Russula brevipes]|nr:hypothetical protein BC826DRAFT_1046550 [Russula brevipes]
MTTLLTRSAFQYFLLNHFVPVEPQTGNFILNHDMVRIKWNLLQHIARSNLALSRRLGRFPDIALSRALVLVRPQTALVVLKHTAGGTRNISATKFIEKWRYSVKVGDGTSPASTPPQCFFSVFGTGFGTGLTRHVHSYAICAQLYDASSA